jgi:hypothetical protein
MFVTGFPTFPLWVLFGLNAVNELDREVRPRAARASEPPERSLEASLPKVCRSLGGVSALVAEVEAPGVPAPRQTPERR